MAHPRGRVRRRARPGSADCGHGAHRTSTVSFDEAIEATRTGDLWIFRGGTVADRVIQTASNAPVNHVGMAVVLDDLPPLMWHAELGRSLRDHWTGDHHRGVQLHDLREAVTTWQGRYGQRAWLRQLSPDVGREQEDAVLRTIARLDGVSFPSTMGLAWRWLRGRDGYLSRREAERKGLRPEDAYCAEVVAVTLEEMGVLATTRRRTGTTRAGSGAVTRCRCGRAGPTASRSRWRAPRADAAPRAARRPRRRPRARRRPARPTRTTRRRSRRPPRARLVKTSSGRAPPASQAPATKATEVSTMSPTVIPAERATHPARGGRGAVLAGVDPVGERLEDVRDGA